MEKGKDSKDKTEELPKNKKLKVTQDEYLATIEIKSIERDCLNRVFTLLTDLQEQPSSDDESAQKKYKKEIEARANDKKMKLKITKTGVKSGSITMKTKKNFEEDEEDSQNREDNQKKEKSLIGLKAIRKVLRTLCSEYPKEEMEMMIWEVDENLDGYVSEHELDVMYKRCVTDAMESEPKRLYYLVQFLMYDKERKGFITEEDTLEILYIRNEKNFNEAIDAIFE
jgi:Ca2+-binding EF-hand superfamily protein